jgi:cytochrome b
MIPDVQLPVKTLRVWDLLVRIFHWSLVITFASAWLTSATRDDTHQWLGLAAATLIGLRVVWGIIGKPYARFTQFIRSPLTVLHYIFSIFRGTEARYIGHNPAGGFMVLALLAGVASTAIAGWLMTTDAYFGDDTMQAIHSLCANTMLVLVVLHVGGVLLASLRHSENLVKAMITGFKRSPQKGDVA